MSLSSRAIALQGVGFAPLAMAAQGLLAVGVVPPEEEFVWYVPRGAPIKRRKPRTTTRRRNEEVLFLM